MMAGVGVRPRVLFYVQHLLGIGHLVRASRVAKALADADFDVAVVLGGEPTPGFGVGKASILALPPVKAGTGFSALVHPDERPFGDVDRNRRRDLLLAHFAAFAPDVLMIEAFPFGRRQMRFELLPLLEAARARPSPPLVVSSVRDILQASRAPERLAETVDTANRAFDLILVHGDPRLARLEESFPSARELKPPIAYSGLVVPPASTAHPVSRRRGVVVSVGGGAVGGALLMAAVAARPRTGLAHEPWLLLAGPNLPAEARAAVERNTTPGLTIQAFVPDLAGTLRGAALSISQAGYNTVTDILVAACPSVLVPFSAGGETEQGVRARKLEGLGLAVSIDEGDLHPSTLARAVDRAAALPRPAVALDLDGARRSASLLGEALARRPRN